MIAFFGLASVLHKPVEFLFPNTGSEFMNRIYNRIIMPRQKQYYYPKCIIMWSSVSAASFQSSGRSNHFVPVFKIKPHDNSNLPQFLEKSISEDLSSFRYNSYINLIEESVDLVEKPIDLVEELVNLVEKPVNLVEEPVDLVEEPVDLVEEPVDLVKEPVIDNLTIKSIANNSKEQNNIIGLFMGIDNKYISNISKLDNYLIYPEAKDFCFIISYQKILNTLFIYDMENFNYHWRPWQISNYH